jgi:hypothetical protein
MSIKSMFLYPLVGIISEYVIGKEMEENRCYPVWCVTLAFVWKNLGIARRTSGQDSLFPGRDLNPGIPAGGIPTGPWLPAYLLYQ